MSMTVTCEEISDNPLRTITFTGSLRRWRARSGAASRGIPRRCWAKPTAGAGSFLGQFSLRRDPTRAIDRLDRSSSNAAGRPDPTGYDPAGAFGSSHHLRRLRTRGRRPHARGMWWGRRGVVRNLVRRHDDDADGLHRADQRHHADIRRSHDSECRDRSTGSCRASGGRLRGISRAFRPSAGTSRTSGRTLIATWSSPESHCKGCGPTRTARTRGPSWDRGQDRTRSAIGSHRSCATPTTRTRSGRAAPTPAEACTAPTTTVRRSGNSATWRTPIW